MSTVAAPERPVGALLRAWRERRRLSQLEVALSGAVSTRHLSWVENGRARPTSEMILRLSEHLDVPLRERNRLLLAGGYAPAYPETGLGTPPMSAVHEAIEHVLHAHRPNPVLVVDRGWELVAANPALEALLARAGAAPELLEPPVNVLRLSLHPEGLAPRIVNLAQWRSHLLERLGREAEASGDPALVALRDELAALPAPGTDRRGAARGDAAPDGPTVIVPLVLDLDGAELRLLSTTTVFGTPQDVTVAELAIETFFPADAPTARRLAELDPAAARPGTSAARA